MSNLNGISENHRNDITLMAIGQVITKEIIIINIFRPQMNWLRHGTHLHIAIIQSIVFDIVKTDFYWQHKYCIKQWWSVAAAAAAANTATRYHIAKLKWEMNFFIVVQEFYCFFPSKSIEISLLLFQLNSQRFSLCHIHISSFSS